MTRTRILVITTSVEYSNGELNWQHIKGKTNKKLNDWKGIHKIICIP